MLFDRLHHVCIVVHDIERTASAYQAAGVGPWHDFPSLAVFTTTEVPDREGFVGLTYKWARIGEVQLQLCQPGIHDTPQRRFLEERGEGVYHLGFDVNDIAFGQAQAAKQGLSVSAWGRKDNGGGFAYLDTAPSLGVVLELRSSGSPS